MRSQKTIFVVDDSTMNLLMVKDALCEHYKVFTFSSVVKMLTILEKITPDLIILDIEMPLINGFETLKILKSDELTKKIPVIFFTVIPDVRVEASGFALGAVDFIRKPITKITLLSRIKTHLDIDELIHKQTSHIEKLQYGTILVLANIIENRDKSTGSHVERTVSYLQILVKAMLKHGLKSDLFNDKTMDLFVSSSRMHDVGKIVLSDALLNKPGKLTPEEYEEVKKHTLSGEKIIDDIIKITDGAYFLQNAKFFAAYHHECWDGSGYPYGLKEREIPLNGRIMKIADMYDALVSERPYKKPMTHKQAVDIIMDGSGTAIDPEIAKVFYKIHEEFNIGIK